MHAERVGDRRLDRIGVRHRDDGDTRVALDQPRERAGDPCLHLDERLTPGEAEAARMALHDLPLALAAESPQRPACPGTDIEFGELPLDADGAAARLRDRRRGLAGALERGGVDRLDLRVRREPPRDGRGLAAPVVGEVQTRRAAREDGSRRRGERVADEQDQRRRLHRAPFRGWWRGSGRRGPARRTRSP